MRKDSIVCTIGGGSGMPIVNKALIAAGYTNIRSVVTTFDSGGDSGRMRTDERGRIMAFSDYWRSLISLWQDGKQKEVWEEMLRFRDGRDRNFGNIFFQFMAEKVGDLSDVDSLFSRLTGAVLKGQVVPVSSTPADVHFKTLSGKEYVGEHMMDELRMSKDKIVDLWLVPDIEANPEVIEVIKKSELIIVCPGSMHGSVIVNLLPTGIRQALVKSSAKKLLMTNIMSMAIENDGFDQKMYVETIERYLGCKRIFDYIVMADLQKINNKLLTQILSYYEMEHSYPIMYNPSFKGIETIVADIATVEKKNMRLRHSEEKMAKFFNSLKF